MELSSLFTHQANQEKAFICLLLSDVTVQAFLVDVTSGVPAITAQSATAIFSSQEQAVIKTDEVLQDLGKESESINEVAFGFEDAWMVSGDIREDKKPLVHQLSADLSLIPIGFVVLSEAVIEQLSLQDAYFSGFILSFGQEGLTCSLLLKGRLIGTERVGLSGDVTSDVAEGFARFAQMIQEDQDFPSKIYITSLSFDQVSLLDIQQDLLGFDWSSQEKFLQTPEIIILEQAARTHYLVQQLALAVAQAKGIVLESEQLLSQQDDHREVPLSDDQPSSDAFGFETVEMHADASIQTAEPEPEPDVVPTSFGIPIAEHQHITSPEVRNEVVSVQSTENEVSSGVIKQKHSFFTRFFKKKSHLMTDKSVKTTHSPPLSLRGSIVLGVIAGILVTIVLGYVYLLQTTVVTAHIELVKKPVAREVLITLDSVTDSTDPENLRLAAETVSKQVTKSDFVQTTGTGIDGEKAQGKVILYNKTTAQKKFPKGTELKIDDLIFLLNDDVAIASASVTEKDGGEEKEYGKTETTVTAATIGADSNLAKDTTLVIESFANSSYEATVVEGLTGGSSREFQTVAEADIATVLQQVSKLITAEAQDLFEDDTLKGVYYIPSEDIQIISQKYDAQVGDEADVVEVTVVAEVSALAYNSQDLRPLASAVLGASIPTGFELGDQEPEILSLPKKATDSAQVSQQIVANISTLATPIVSQDDIYARIQNKKISEAELSLQEGSTVTSVDFTFKPSLAEHMLTKLPSSRDQIVFDLQ